MDVHTAHGVVIWLVGVVVTLTILIKSSSTAELGSMIEAATSEKPREDELVLFLVVGFAWPVIVALCVFIAPFVGMHRLALYMARLEVNHRTKEENNNRRIKELERELEELSQYKKELEKSIGTSEGA